MTILCCPFALSSTQKQPDPTEFGTCNTLLAFRLGILSKDYIQTLFSRWDKGYENCRLDDIPHKRLTAPAQVLDFRFDGMQRQQGRSNLLKLEVAEAGTLNAIAFWFDLHLDAECTITTGACPLNLPSFASS